MGTSARTWFQQRDDTSARRRLVRQLERLLSVDVSGCLDGLPTPRGCAPTGASGGPISSQSGYAGRSGIRTNGSARGISRGRMDKCFAYKPGAVAIGAASRRACTLA